MALQLRRGSNTARSSTVFAAGEPVWTTDTTQLYVGDGITAGGILVAGGGGSTNTFVDVVVDTELSIGTGTYRMFLGQSPTPYDNQFYITGNGNVNDKLFVDQFNLVQFNSGNQLQVESTATFNGGVAIASTLTVTGNATANSVVTQDLVSSGGFPVDSSGMALIRTSNTQTPAMVVSNYTAGLLPEVVVRGYGSNRPGGPTATTPGAAGIIVESSRGTHTAPTVPGVGDVIGSFSAGSYDGTRWSGDMNIYPAQIIATAAETWAGNATTTTNAGSRLEMWVQPPAVQLNSTSRFRPMRHVWTAGNVGTGTPPVLNIHEGSGQDGAPTLTPASGTGSFGTGSGRVNLVKINTNHQIFGVPQEDTAADNPSLLGTNAINFISGRRSGVLGRRNKLLVNDTIGSLTFAGQVADNATGLGAGAATITVVAAENFGAAAAGGTMKFATTLIGTNAGTTDRLRLNSSSNSYISGIHDFSDNSATAIASLNTSTAQFFVPVVVNELTVNGLNTVSSLRFGTETAITSRAELIGPTGPAGDPGVTGPTGPAGATGGYSGTESVYALGNTSGTLAVDATSATIFTMTLTGNLTMNAITNVVTGTNATFVITQDGTGGRTLTSSWKFAGGAKTLTTSGTATDMISVFYDGSTYYASLSRGFV
jgi:hypothetical protein